ncbi:MAG: hypothetical protein JEZ11_06380 [Desulfobacterales bacterium]|nr:hypothetical protein [Desulfobacterales bacterium]
MVEGFFRSHPLIIAHRGVSARFPENTLAAFAAALDAGAEMVELDVTLTRDRHLVVIHDDTLDRTTDGRGEVAALTLSELGQLDAGFWFDPAFSGERIPTLDEVLALARGRAQVNIEIKVSAFEPEAPTDAVERQAVVAARRYAMVDAVVISSFEPRILRRLAALAGAVPRLAVLTETPFAQSDLDLCRELNAWSLNPGWSFVTQAMVTAAHRDGIRVLPYTVNDLDLAKALLNMGVDGFFTDDPVGLAGI